MEGLSSALEKKEVEMFRKILLSLFLLMGMLSLAFCTSQRASPIPEGRPVNPTNPTIPPSPSPLANMANPASVYCEKNGDKLELRQDASGGVQGICVFQDASECDEWAHFRSECKPGDSLVKPA